MGGGEDLWRWRGGGKEGEGGVKLFSSANHPECAFAAGAPASRSVDGSIENGGSRGFGSCRLSV